MATVTSDEEVPPQNMASMVSLTRNVQLYTTFSEVMQVGEQAAASGDEKGEDEWKSRTLTFFK